MLKMQLLEIFVLLFAVGSVVSKFYLIETDEKTAKNNIRKVFCILDCTRSINKFRIYSIGCSLDSR